MSASPQYGVKFIGYSASVSAQKDGYTADYGTLDFVSGSVSVSADDGLVIAPNIIDLESFMMDLPKLINELQDRLGTLSPSPETTNDAVSMIDLPCGANIVSVIPGTKIAEFVCEVASRFAEIKQVFQEAQAIGSRIKRRPYSEYIDEIERTGICRVEYHGFGFFVDGKLRFQPDHLVALVRPGDERPDALKHIATARQAVSSGPVV